MENEKKKDSINEAIKAVDENKHQDLGKENLGNEPEEQMKARTTNINSKATRTNDQKIRQLKKVGQ